MNYLTYGDKSNKSIVLIQCNIIKITYAKFKIEEIEGMGHGQFLLIRLKEYSEILLQFLKG